MEPLHPIFNKKVYIVIGTCWGFYILQIIIILLFSFLDMKNYKSSVMGFDLFLFINTCLICIFITFSIAKNKSLYYKWAIASTALFDAMIIISIVYLILNKHSNIILLLIIKIFEIIPGFVIYFNPKLIIEEVNNNNNNGIVNNNVAVNNNNINNNNINNNEIMNNDINIINNNLNNGIINNDDNNDNINEEAAPMLN